MEEWISNLTRYYAESGSNPESELKQLEKNPRYLNELVLDSATEIDDYLAGRNTDFSHTQKLSEIVGNFKVKEMGYVLLASFLGAIKKDSEKQYRLVNELSLEINLLKSDLREIPNFNSDRLAEMRGFLCSLSSYLTAFSHNNRYNYLVA